MIKQADKLDYAIELVELIVGDVNSVGETNHDTQSVDNLKVLCDLVEVLLQNIISEWNYTSYCYESSRNQSHEVAEQYLQEFYKMLDENEVM